ncbi:hypothetical protein CYV15_07860 [Riemerella anatipestifer]|uniref:hypothetical protein n=1 Tax=Riemerella anatipestifer TaxID=34085 RepID=UPI000D13F0A6|nr:hypothetical protein [Riemerella anatipestifer]MDD1525277.1 hypothetical protein [Riemerella anatipestifer]MDY3318874.1 hypothetical protein [Riemerella anatipestifer]MDY3325145.1 hypothetical protein [Riemerella anatipestifer]MDY3352866.1 hypothetical protein [Riemerella anatipestifer]PST43713.1 hypothetical protein CYV15_07860 [Riemerella anatipestifer]
MKTNTIILLFSLFIFFTNCTKQPKCNDEEVQNRVTKAIKQHIDNEIKNELEVFTEDENYSDFKPIIESRKKLIDEFEFKIHSIRTDDTKEEVRRCDCLGEISSIEKNKDIEAIKEDLKELGFADFRILGISPTIKYTAQITDDEKVYITIHNPEELKIYERNVLAKILYKIRLKNQELTNNNSNSYNNIYDDGLNNLETNNMYHSIKPNTYYNIYASPNNPVHFFNSPNGNDRMKARFTTNEQVYVEQVYNNFGYIEFTNLNNQTTKGWIWANDLHLIE